MTRIFRSLDEARGRFGPCAIAIGKFDGVHLGHQAVLGSTVKFVWQKRLIPAALTFDPHPAAVIAPERDLELIMPLEERLQLMLSQGIESILVLPFTPEVARLTPTEFVRQILVDALETKAVLVGENFLFGHRQAGTPATLRALGDQLGFVSQFVPPVTCRGEVVSSSAVRGYISTHRIARANRLLGRCFSIRGEVVAGRGIGSKQTVPTLNLLPPSGQLLPRGVYITETLEDGSDRHWPSITNVGIRPTFGERQLTIETYLLSPLTAPDPESIRVVFREFVRQEKAFESAEALKLQIFRDVRRAQVFWRRAAALRSRTTPIY